MKGTYQVSYNPAIHYFTQKQEDINMICSNSETLKLSTFGSYLATLVMIMKQAGLTTLNGVSLSSAQAIATDLFPKSTLR